MQVYHNIGEAVQGIVKQKGFRGLYSGLSVTLMEIIPYAALQFGFYDAFTAAYANTRRHINPQVCHSLTINACNASRFGKPMVCGLLKYK